MTRPHVKDDRVALWTRALAVFIVPFLVTAFAILYFWPDDTGRLFAWRIAPSVTSFLLGSAYIGGAYFFVRVSFEKRWHHVSVGFLPVTAFASLMLIATLLHWDKFSHGNVAFWAWVSVYSITPVLVFSAWLRNRRADPGMLDASDARTPTAVRRSLGALGTLVLAVGLGLFIAPGALMAIWPWPLTPLTSRVVGSCFVLTGVTGLAIAADPRWTAARIVLQSQMLAIVLILVGAVRGHGSFDPGSVLTWLFAIGLSVLLVAIAALYAALEMRLRPAR